MTNPYLSIGRSHAVAGLIRRGEYTVFLPYSRILGVDRSTEMVSRKIQPSGNLAIRKASDALQDPQLKSTKQHHIREIRTRNVGPGCRVRNISFDRVSLPRSRCRSDECGIKNFCYWDHPAIGNEPRANG